MKNRNLSALIASLLLPLSLLNSQELDKKTFSSATDALTQLSDISRDIRVDVPRFEIQTTPQTDSDVNAVCQYPNHGIYPGKDIIPVISDKKRVATLLSVIIKISKCEKLPYKEDGQVFKNKEKKLPEMPHGYYREYTVVMPKDSDKEFYIGGTHYTAYPSFGKRGPERIVIGGGEKVYYTPTHYDSFIEMTVIPAY